MKSPTTPRAVWPERGHWLRQPVSEPGSLTPEQIVAEVRAGLYVTSLMGFGVNSVTGDYSRGATGLWIENGQLTHAVEEVTIAGTSERCSRT